MSLLRRVQKVTVFC